MPYRNACTETHVLTNAVQKQFYAQSTNFIVNIFGNHNVMCDVVITENEIFHIAELEITELEIFHILCRFMFMFENEVFA